MACMLGQTSAAGMAQPSEMVCGKCPTRTRVSDNPRSHHTFQKLHTLDIHLPNKAGGLVF